MRYELTQRVEQRELPQLEPRILRAFWKQLAFLLNHGPGYPSLDVHPWPAHGDDAKQARVTLDWRFYFYQRGDTYVIYRVQKHPKSTQRGR